MGASTRRVLVVDDEPVIRALIRASLGRDRRPQLLLAEDGEQALEAARRWKPDIVLLDVRMPKLDGLEVCRRLRGDSQTAAAKIVMLTAMGQDDDLAEGYAAGADDYLVKPFDPDALLDKVQSSMGFAAW